MCSDRWSCLRVWTQGETRPPDSSLFLLLCDKTSPKRLTRGESRAPLAGRVLSQQHDICISQYGRSIWAAGVRAGSDVWKRKEGVALVLGVVWQEVANTETVDWNMRVQTDTWLYINVKTHQRGSLLQLNTQNSVWPFEISGVRIIQVFWIIVQSKQQSDVSPVTRSSCREAPPPPSWSVAPGPRRVQPAGRWTVSSPAADGWIKTLTASLRFPCEVTCVGNQHVVLLSQTWTTLPWR